MVLTELIDTMAGGDVLRWDKVTSLPINEFLFKWNYLIQKAKKAAQKGF